MTTEREIDYEQDLRALVYEYAETRLSADETISFPSLADEIANTYVADQAQAMEIARAFTRERAYRLLTEWARARRAVPLRSPEDAIVPISDGVVAQSLLDRRVSESRWQRWVEHVGTRVAELTSLKRSDLQVAAAERLKRSGSEWVRAQFLLTLGRKLPDDRTTVGEFFSASSLTDLYRETERQGLRQLHAAGTALLRPRHEGSIHAALSATTGD